MMHRLKPHFEILNNIERRLRILSMTYDNKATCFIPGKVLDECYRVLREVMSNRNQIISSEVLREFQDLCSMAVEQFEEQILPTIKRKQKNPMNNHQYPVLITALERTSVNKVLPSGKDQLRAQENSLLSLSQPNPLSQLEIKLKNCELKCYTQEQEISQLKKTGAEQAKELKEHSRKWIEWEQQNKLKPKAIDIPVLSKQTAAKSATPSSSTKSDISSQKWLEFKKEKLKVDSIPAAIPKKPVSATLATRSSKPSAPETCLLLKAEGRSYSTALRMIEGKIRPSKVLPLLFGSVTFSVNQSLTIEGIVIPTQLFFSNSSEAVYKENLRFFLKDGNGNTLAASSLYEGLTHRGTLLSLYFKRPLFIQSDRNCVLDLHVSSAGSYPLGAASTSVFTTEGVRFLFTSSNNFSMIENEVRSGLIRLIIFCV